MHPSGSRVAFTGSPIAAQRHEPAVPLDACTADVGERVVWGLDGRVMVMGFDASQQFRQADDQAHPGRRLRAGGDWFRDAL